MCDLMVTPEAPVPPPAEIEFGDVATLRAWAAYFPAASGFYDTVSDSVEGLANSDDSVLVQSAFEGFLGAKAKTALGTLAVTLADPELPDPESMMEAWSGAREQLDLMCPQWTGQTWPYQGEAASATSAPATPAEYKKVSSREWKKIAKDPDGAKGRTIIVYGRISQFDSATGTDSFRADVEGSKQSAWYDYDTNTILQGAADQLADFVEDDIFVAKVTVLGSFEYETTMGGNASVPLLQIDSIKRIGSAG